MASAFGTEWLHLYTTNPTLKSPDMIKPYTRINTGVLYTVRKGE
eukprot:CAMPEP_0173390766 /NCGR_PEP_ID=MMETSP1356-20130122/16080_1 /TAXON_ID=77927 ORGANISM="Hemiselmis virescens, Strain PCC157" /NCGR_SAMPLE_ID=MMETSP1356 /ASSEMBLY_ACC=CAM_ASM_000847 /LENGTH=43 /DNA_ID= /DNA_START= /DNA_END= /DNA_ORIENTATION=